jgi:hypothetical protein
MDWACCASERLTAWSSGPDSRFLAPRNPRVHLVQIPMNLTR